MSQQHVDYYQREWIAGLEPPTLYEHSEFKLEKVVGIQKKGNQFHCLRCQNEDPSRFATLYEQEVIYCRECLTFGRVTTDTYLIRSYANCQHQSKTAGLLTLTQTLSTLQQKASDAAVCAFNRRRNHYTWAVCGAGKTEMMFQVVSEALNQGHRVCWAIPRTDVVIELKPRLQQAFKQAQVIALYGQSTQKHHAGEIVLSTTHQLIHFHEAFELIIIDEVDAFPYTHDQMLPRLVNKAKTKTGVILYLSATPSSDEQKQIRTEQMSSFIVPMRYHGHPLDVPQFKACYNYNEHIKNNRIPKSLKRYLMNQKANRRKTLLFIPTIQIGEQLSQLLNIELVHSQDEMREQKVKTYKKTETLFLLTTMILERGITIIDIDVAVIGAESELFTESALVQISGRVGRHKDYPHGTITFFHDGISKSMIDAQTHIKRMNEKDVS